MQNISPQKAGNLGDYRAASLKRKCNSQDDLDFNDLAPAETIKYWRTSTEDKPNVS